MELIGQHTKKIMEGCKERARAAGLKFQNESLEYIVTNRNLIELLPKFMIPTMYDYWVHDVEVLKEKGKYELYPRNPYETVINTRPAISFYNDNNPDWLNVMIFYHVLAHVDFFQNNLYYRHTWDIDFTGQALADKRLIAQLRSEHGRWVDYVIEFARSLDNLVGYFDELSGLDQPVKTNTSKFDFYFDVFLQAIKEVRGNEYSKEVERYNGYSKFDLLQDQVFFADTVKKYPEFDALFKKSLKKKNKRLDVMQFVMEHSSFLNRDENKWMLQVIEIVRKTSIFFQPQIRTKIMNEGWASYWHERLFLQDERISEHEVDFARVHASVTSLPRVGLNPYALGMRLFQHLEGVADKGRNTFDYLRLQDSKKRKEYDKKTGQGQKYIAKVRENYCDFTFISDFVDQGFMDRHKLFVAGKRLNEKRMTWEYYVKSRKAEDYRQMLLDELYHPPHITVSKIRDGKLFLKHEFEGKPLIREFIRNTLMGAAWLWGDKVSLRTTELEAIRKKKGSEEEGSVETRKIDVVYTYDPKKPLKERLSREVR